MKEDAQKALKRCVSLAFSDDLWRFWGFPKRPKYGSFVNKFRPKWRVELERKLFAEIIISNAAAYVVGGVLDSDGLDEFVRFFTADARLCNCIGRNSSTHLRNDILEYAEAPVDKWPVILADRLSIDKIKDNELARGVFWGCAQYSFFAINAVDLAKRDA